MEILSSARFAQLARIRSVVRSVRSAFLGSGEPPDNNPDDCNSATLRDARGTACDAGVVRNEKLTSPVKEAFTGAAAAVFGRCPMMGRACPKMGSAGQSGACAGAPSRPASQMTSVIAPENQVNPDLAVVGEVVSVQVCVMAWMTQQYRCRRRRQRALLLQRSRWMVNLECINLLR